MNANLKRPNNTEKEDDEFSATLKKRRSSTTSSLLETFQDSSETSELYKLLREHPNLLHEVLSK